MELYLSKAKYRDREGYTERLFIEDEKGRTLFSIQGNQLDPEGLSIAEARSLAEQLTGNKKRPQ